MGATETDQPRQRKQHGFGWVWIIIDITGVLAVIVGVQERSPTIGLLGVLIFTAGEILHRLHRIESRL